jgi:hypothetical protein
MNTSNELSIKTRAIMAYQRHCAREGYIFQQPGTVEVYEDRVELFNSKGPLAVFKVTPQGRLLAKTPYTSSETGDLRVALVEVIVTAMDDMSHSEIYVAISGVKRGGQTSRGGRFKNLEDALQAVITNHLSGGGLSNALVHSVLTTLMENVAHDPDRGKTPYKGRVSVTT